MCLISTPPCAMEKLPTLTSQIWGTSPCIFPQYEPINQKQGIHFHHYQIPCPLLTNRASSTEQTMPYVPNFLPCFLLRLINLYMRFFFFCFYMYLLEIFILFRALYEVIRLVLSVTFYTCQGGTQLLLINN